MKDVKTVLVLYIFGALLLVVGTAKASDLARGQKYFFKSDYKKALGNFQRALSKNPNNPILLYLIGKSHMELGADSPAREALEKAVTLKPDYGLARLNLARLCHRMRELSCAKHNYDYLQKHHPRELKNNDKKILARLQDQQPSPVTPSAAAAKPSSVVDTVPPDIVILSPKLNLGIHRAQAASGSSNTVIPITGLAVDNSGILHVTINGSPVPMQKSGRFETKITLVPGENPVRIRVIDRAGNLTVKDIVIIQRSEFTAKQPDPALKPGVLGAAGERNFALLIGVADYDDPAILDLDQPIVDAQRLEALLTRIYTFGPKRVLFLKNPTRSRIVNTFYGLSQIIRKEDNLLIFYAGHGFWDEAMAIGYWLPKNAKKKNRSEWLSNTTVRDYIGGIKSRHTLLIADACFSGGIFKTRRAFDRVTPAVQELYKLNSRKAMTSGTLTEVPDKSVFVSYMLKYLEENPKKYLSSQELFSQFRTAVINNSPTHQVPQYGTIHGVGDEGGDLIFVKR